MIRSILIIIMIMVSTPLMAKCLVIGDSIAYGTATQFKQCQRDAKVGISSTAVLKRALRDSSNFDYVIVSAGSNDPTNRRLKSNLLKIKNHFSGTVIFILPQNRTAARAVLSVARVSISFSAGKDHIHPKSYLTLGNSIKSLFNNIN